MSEALVLNPFVALRPRDEGSILPNSDVEFPALPDQLAACEKPEAVRQRQARLENTATSEARDMTQEKESKTRLIILGAQAISAAQGGESDNHRKAVTEFNGLSASMYPWPTPAGIVRAARELRQAVEAEGEGREDKALAETRAEYLDFLDEVESRAGDKLQPGESVDSLVTDEERSAMYHQMHGAIMEQSRVTVEWIYGDWESIKSLGRLLQAFGPDDMQKIFNRDFRYFAEVQEHAPWLDWKLIDESEAGGYRTESERQRMYIPGKARPLSLVETIATALHEEFHAMRGENGRRYGIEAQANYAQPEEGGAVLIGWAASGYKPTSPAFSYAMPALAGGDLGRTFTRKELFEARVSGITLERAVREKQGIENSIGNPKDVLEIQKMTAATINRTLKLEGDPDLEIPSMIYGHDTVYHAGYELIEAFVVAALRQYKASAVLRYLQLAHFNPVNLQDTKYVNGRLHELGKEDWIVKAA